MGQIFSRTERRTENNDVEVAADSNGTPTTRKRKGNINDGGALRKKKISKVGQAWGILNSGCFAKLWKQKLICSYVDSFKSDGQFALKGL